MGALDDDFAHELFDAKAAEFNSTRFDIGARIGTRVELEEDAAECAFEKGVCVEVGHALAYLLPAVVAAAWTEAGGLTGAFGAPISDPVEIDAARAVQEFEAVAFIFGTAVPFAIPQPFWDASLGGQGTIGTPTGSPQALAVGGAVIVPHDRGVVLAVGTVLPQALPQVVFAEWTKQESAGTSLGPPVGAPFPDATNNVFPFRFGQITVNSAGAIV